VAGESILPLNRPGTGLFWRKGGLFELLFLLAAVLFLIPGCGYSKKIVIPPSGPLRVPEKESRPKPVYLGEKIALTAKSFVGVPYQYGGNDPNGFDCSGLAQYVYERYGLNLPRRAEDQIKTGFQVHRRDLMPGDLVFFKISWSKDYHVGIFVGDGCFVHAPRSGRRVEIQRLDGGYYADRYIIGRRIISEGQM